MNTNTINYITIVESIKELIKVEKNEIVVKLQNILNHNEIPKSELHNRKNDKLTSYYKVDLSEDELDVIKDLFLDLEVKSLSDEGEATNETEHYLSLLDNWLTISYSDNNSTGS